MSKPDPISIRTAAKLYGVTPSRMHQLFERHGVKLVYLHSRFAQVSRKELAKVPKKRTTGRPKIKLAK